MDEVKQPDALHLADLIERYNSGVHSQAIVEDYCKASAELRRLHDENKQLRAAVHKFHAAKGRYHTQLAVCDLFDLCGLPNERPKK